MSIYPDKKDGKLTGRWRVEVQLNGLRKRGRFHTMPEAQDAEKLWTQELSTGITEGTTSRDTGVKTLTQLLDRAAPLLWNGSDHGELSVKKVRWIAEACGDILLTKLDSEYVERAILKLRAAGKAPGTVNRYLSALHKVLSWGAARGRQYVTVVPDFDWQDEDEGRIRYLTPEEEHRLIATLRALGNDEAADLCIVAVDTGCRRGELLSAEAHQLDGKWLRLWKTKNGNPRSVPLTERARAILQARLPWQIKEHQLRYAWDKAKVALDLSHDEDFVFHALRHTRATRLVQHGVNLRVIQQFMGHKAIQTTLRYAHVSDDMLAKAAELVTMENVQLVDNIRLTQPVGDRPTPSDAPHPQRTVLEAVE